jgi:hypothetical protein
MATAKADIVAALCRQRIPVLASRKQRRLQESSARSEVIHTAFFGRVVLVAIRGTIAMTDIEDATSEAPDHHSRVATMAPFWILLLALIAAIEIGTLPVTRSLLAALFW